MFWRRQKPPVVVPKPPEAPEVVVDLKWVELGALVAICAFLDPADFNGSYSSIGDDRVDWVEFLDRLHDSVTSQLEDSGCDRSGYGMRIRAVWPKAE